jgi:hypothetical protein
MRRICFLSFLIFSISNFSLAQTRSLTGKYRNPALGYSIEIPSGLKGVTGDQAGPERGVTIVLPSGGEVKVFGEPNSFEWKTPAEGVRYELSHEKCAGKPNEISYPSVGKLEAAKGRLLCADRLVIVLLTFRPRGGPVYWLRLDTSPKYESADSAVLMKIANSFKLIHWQ